MTYPTPLTNPAQDNAPVIVNENLEVISAAAIYGRRHAVTTGLTWGYHGGLYNGNTIADGTVALTNTADNYVVVLRSTGVVSVSTSSANSVNPLYAKLYKVPCASGAITEASVIDQRWDSNGLWLSGGGSAVAANVPAARYTIELANTTDSDPGAGLLKFNNATPASATFLYIDDSTSDGVDLSTYFAGLGASGYVTIQSVADAGEWAIFKWTAITDGTGYFKFAVTAYASLGTLDDADAVLVAFDSDASASGSVATDAIWDAVGDLVVGTGANTAARLAAGTNGHVLTLAAGTPAWQAPASGSGTKTYATFTPMTSQPPLANFATLDTRNSIAVLDFDDTTEESIFWVDVMPEAASLGSGLIVNIFFMASTATSGDARFGAQFERMNTDLDADSFDTATEATVATSATSGIVTKLSITCTTIDSIAAGELYRLKIYRDTTGADTITGDVEVVAVEVRSAA